MREPEMQEWVSGMKPEEKKRCKLTEEMSTALDRFFFNHYCHAFRSGAFARANSSMYVPLDFISSACQLLKQTNGEYVWYGSLPWRSLVVC